MTQQETNKKIRVGFALLFSVSFAILPLLSGAAELKLSSPTQEVGLNQPFQIDLMLDAEDDDINAVEGQIVFPADLLILQNIIDGDSIINLWVERPKITRKDTNMNTNRHEVVFSGIIPGGFTGILSPFYHGARPGKVLSFVFFAKNLGSGLVEIQNSRVLLNDGKGTPAETKIFNFQFSIFKEAPPAPPMVETVKDTDPPEDFKPEIASTPDIFEGKWFLVFFSQDKGSGIAHYAIHELTQKKDITRIDTKKWVEAESPYVLKDQKLRSWIYVKAVDKAGNERIAVVEPRHPIKWYEIWWILGIIIISGIIIIYFVGRILWRKHTKIHE